MSSGKLLRFLTARNLPAGLAPNQSPIASSPSAALSRFASSVGVKRRSVWKFGGSSVGSAQAFRNCAGVILANHEANNETVAVLSAMFGVTNKLLDAAHAAVRGDPAKVQKLRGDLLSLHTKTAAELVGQAGLREEYGDYVSATFGKYFDAVCEDVARRRACDAYDTDRLSSVGERWSSRLMSTYMRDLGYDAPFVGSDELIVTDGCSGNARPILDATRQRVQEVLQPLLQRGALPVVTGYFGASETGKLTTLGRGGSDLSAAVLGYCLDADEVSLWKVEYTTRPDGWMDQWTTGWEGVVHDADPTLTIPSLAYEEAAELAHFGKKVLHPETVMPAVEKAIPIAVRNTINPAHPGTRIEWHPQTGRGTARVQAVTRLALKTYETRNAPLRNLDLSHLRVKREEAALVVLVGLNIMSLPHLPERVLGALRERGIPAHAPEKVNGSPNNFSVVVPESQRNEAVALLHDTFVVPGAGKVAVPATAATGASAPHLQVGGLRYNVAFGAKMVADVGGRTLHQQLAAA